MNKGGHFPAEIGRAMEESFADLLIRLGYTVFLTCDQITSLDVIAKFDGELFDPEPKYPCTLIQPFFAPKGIIAFSLKRNVFTPKDVTELIESVKKAKKLEDLTYKSIDGMVIVSNFSQKESAIDKLLKQNVFCWDGRRLIFYSAKVQTIRDLLSRGPVTETIVDGLNNTSCLLETETTEETRNFLEVNISIFIDDHNKELTIGAQHIEKILDYIYNKQLVPLAEQTKFEIQADITLHILGIANGKVVKEAFKKYTSDVPKSRPKIFFIAEPKIFQYGAAPWSILLK